MGNLEDAIYLAANLHSGQKDKAGKCYILHPLSVMKIVEKEIKEHPASLPEGYTEEEMLAAAVLHDAVEDTPVNLDELESRFGANVRIAIDGVTRREGETYAQFIDRAKLNKASRIIKTADLLHNLSRIKNLPVQEQSIQKRYARALQVLNDI